MEKRIHAETNISAHDGILLEIEHNEWISNSIKLLN